MNNPNFMTSLARGLDVIRGFSAEKRHMSIAQPRTGIPPAAVCRCLFTLRELGYVDCAVLQAGRVSLRDIRTLYLPHLQAAAAELGAQLVP